MTFHSAIVRRLLDRFGLKSAFAIAAVIGIVVAGLSLWAFTAIADAVTDNSAIVGFDKAIAAFVETHSTEAGEAFFSVLSLFGSVVLSAIVGIVGVVLFLRGHRMRCIGLFGTAASGVGLNYALKAIFHRGRPETAAEFIHHTSWSFPSGHAMTSTICYGFMLFLFLDQIHGNVRRRLVIAAVVLLVALISFSRVYLGVHYTSDVVGGALAGVTWLLTCVALYEIVRARHRAPRASV